MNALLILAALLLANLFLAYYIYCDEHKHSKKNHKHEQTIEKGELYEQTIEKVDFDVNLNMIPNAKILKSAMIEAEKVNRPKRQENGLKEVGDKIRALSESNVHELTLYQDYMSKIYSLNFMMLKKVLETQHYNVSAIKDSYGADLILIQW